MNQRNMVSASAILCRMLVGLAVALFAVRARAETYYVATNGSDGVSGTEKWENALQTITAALAKATSDGDVVWLSNGVHVLDGPELQVNRAITLQGYSADAAETVIDGNYPTRSGRCLTINHADALVCHLTIRNGYTNNTGGGGVYIDASGGTISNCVVVSNKFTGANSSYGGGGIWGGAKGLIRHCTLQGNSADTGSTGLGGGGRGGDYEQCLIADNLVGSNGRGGGLENPQRVVACTVSGNFARHGGGLDWVSGSGDGTISNCTIAGNTANWYGGGVALESSKPGTTCELIGCVISNNTATLYRGGGVSALTVSNELIIRDCTVIGNTAKLFANNGQGGGFSYYTASADSNTICLVNRTRFIGNVSLATNLAGGGGGVYISVSQPEPSVELRNCVLAGNSATRRGGGVSIATYGRVVNCTLATNTAQSAGGLYLGASASATNVIVYHNKATSADPDWSAEAGAVIAYGCVSTSAPDVCVETITDEPAFADLAGGDYRLSTGSPCVNRGLNLPWMDGARDLGGGPRVDGFGRRVDIGAYERLPAGTLFGIR